MAQTAAAVDSTSEYEQVDVPTGYQRTEIGAFPKDWNVDRLSRHWNIIDCKHVTAKFTDFGYPLASITEVQSRYVNLTNANQTSSKFYKKLISDARKPKTDDLIMSRNATVGAVAKVANWHPLFAMGQDVCLLRKKYDEYSTDFLQAILSSSIIKCQLVDLMVG